MAAHQAPLSMGFSRQEYWSGLPCPPPWDLPDPATEPLSCISCIAGGFFTTEPPGKHTHTHTHTHTHIYIYQNIFINSCGWAHRHFLVFAIINNAAMNTWVQISFWDSDFISFGCIYPEVELLDHKVVLLLFLTVPYFLEKSVSLLAKQASWRGWSWRSGCPWCLSSSCFTGW